MSSPRRTRSTAPAADAALGLDGGLQVEEALRAAYRRGYDDLVFAGFSFDDAAQTTVQDDPNPRVRAHLAYIRPDVQMGGLLARAIKGRVDDAAWDAFAGTVSLPFPAGAERRVAVKVIDPRGNEVMRVRRRPSAAGAGGAPA